MAGAALRTLPVPLHGGIEGAAAMEGWWVIARIGYDTRTWNMGNMSGAGSACI
jgi:hypothetical protein